MSEEERGVCSHKAVCNNCPMTYVQDRPQACVSLSCEHYLPCAGCGHNKHGLNEDKLCEVCVTSAPKKKIQAVRSAVQEVKKGRATFEDIVGQTTVGQQPTQELVDPADVITPPGTPPPNFNQSEKDLYIKRWAEYDGYFRDPAAYALVHFMILEEINLHHIQAVLIKTSGERQIEKQNEKMASLRALQIIKDQLPEKEARKLTDDETALGLIYDRYLDEREETLRGKLTRIFDQEAIALAPAIPHPINLRTLLERCGFQTIEVEEALQKYQTDLGTTPEQILESLGFKVREKYAMPFDNNVEDDDLVPSLNEVIDFAPAPEELDGDAEQI